MNRVKELRRARGYSQKELGDLVGRDQTLISKLENGHVDFDMSMADQLSKALGVPYPQLRNTHKNSINSSLQPKIAEPIGDASFGPEMVPIIGRVTDSGDAVILDFDEPIGEAPSHPNQKKIKGGFAVPMNDDTMEPRYWQGEMTHPVKSMRPRPMQDCWLEFINGSSQLRQFIRYTEKDIVCRQFNPPKELRRPKSEIKAIHAIVGRG